MSQAAKAQEPSMEEILASIRRIIADDEGGKPKPKAAQPLPPSPPLTNTSTRSTNMVALRFSVSEPEA